MSITLRPVTADNFDEVACLPLLEHQRTYLASNAYSIAEASFFPRLVTRAVYADEGPIGFMMYAKPAPGDDPGALGIWRFMISSDHQGKGYGRRALALLLSEMRAHPGVRRILIWYLPQNESARRLYASFGFHETGIDEDGEMVAVLSCEDSTGTGL